MHRRTSGVLEKRYPVCTEVACRQSRTWNLNTSVLWIVWNVFESASCRFLSWGVCFPSALWSALWRSFWHYFVIPWRKIYRIAGHAVHFFCKMYQNVSLDNEHTRIKSTYKLLFGSVKYVEQPVFMGFEGWKYSASLKDKMFGYRRTSQSVISRIERAEVKRKVGYVMSTVLYIIYLHSSNMSGSPWMSVFAEFFRPTLYVESAKELWRSGCSLHMFTWHHPTSSRKSEMDTFHTKPTNIDNVLSPGIRCIVS